MAPSFPAEVANTGKKAYAGCGAAMGAGVEPSPHIMFHVIKCFRNCLDADIPILFLTKRDWLRVVTGGVFGGLPGHRW